ncbi:hypothetical protein BWI17_13025 [Betaproteobacteria bacterium GR16-43]|nr:hypothetical protein BWI17_13025 [Betaproteobacteria bacterium GR16-43]
MAIAPWGLMHTLPLRLAIGLFTAALAASAGATTYQVGPTRAFTQITQVTGMLNPGDVVEVDGNATYNTVFLTRSGSVAQPITIRGMAAGAQRPVIHSNLANDDGLRMDVDNYVVEDMVVAGARVKCVYLHGNNLTLRRVQVHTCTKHGILGADTDTGNMTLTEVEVFNQGNSAAPSAFDHPIYIATDHDLYPTAVLRIERSWVHDNFSGNSIKSRARNAKFFHNWLETTNSQNHTIEAIGPDGQSCPVPNGSNAAILCNAEIVGNVLIARGNNANMMRLGGDGTGESFGRYHLVNNTFIANGTFNSNSSAMIRAFDGIDSIELHNNIFWIQQGDTVGIRIVRDAEAAWVSGRRVTGTRNLVTGSAATYASGIPAQQIAGLTNTIFATTASVFVNVSAAALTTPGPLDVRLSAASPARLAGNAGNTSSATFEVPNPTNLPAFLPPRMRPDPGSPLTQVPRPLATNDDGHVVPNATSLGAYEFTAMPFDFSADGKSDLLWQNADGRAAIWLMNGLAATATQEIIGAGTGWSVVQVADLNGDGQKDLVWQHTDGRAAVYLMNGTTPIATQQILNAGPWTITHTPDLNGDGKADLVFQNTDGTVAVWLMNGTAMTAGASIIGAGTGWSVTRTGDFDGDGKDDLLFQNADGRVAIWLMNGVSVKSTGQILNAGTGWSVTHTPDLDGDGKADLVWHNTDGSTAVWLMNGTAMTSGTGLLGAGTGWSVTRAADFDGDGKSDLVWEHTDGRIAIWLMNGIAPSSTTQILNAGGGWTVRRTPDLNGDGKADLVFHNADGRVAAWLMNGAAMTSGTQILGTGTGWGVSGVSQ